MNNWIKRMVVLVCGLSAAGCGDDIRSGLSDADSPSLTDVVRLWGSRQKLDLLFVFKNSPCGRDDQDEWRSQFAALLSDLDNSSSGRPDLHIGIATTDMGTEEKFDIMTCSAEGDGGGLFGSGYCLPTGDSYIVDGFDGDIPRTNYSGALTDVFACVADIGAQGCGFVQPFKAMRAALDKSHATNDGFLRDDANLAVIIVSDKDDCSASDHSLYDPSNEAVGDFSSMRCLQYGMVCDQADLRSPGLKTNCQPDEFSSYLEPVATTVDFVRTVKHPPYRAMVVAMGGQDENGSLSEITVVGTSPNTGIDAVCAREDGSGAHPGLRLHALATELGPLGHFESLCHDFSQSVPSIGEFIRGNLESTCVQGTLVDVDVATEGLQVNCEVFELDGGQERELASCDDTESRPCWLLEKDASCDGFESGLSLTIIGELKNGGDVVGRCELIGTEAAMLPVSDRRPETRYSELKRTETRRTPMYQLPGEQYQCPLNPF